MIFTVKDIPPISLHPSVAIFQSFLNHSQRLHLELVTLREKPFVKKKPLPTSGFHKITENLLREIDSKRLSILQLLT